MPAARRTTSFESAALPRDGRLVRLIVDPDGRSVHIDLGSGETVVLDRIGATVYTTFAAATGDLTSVQVFDDPAQRDPAWCDIVRAIAGDTLTDAASAALRGSEVVDIEVTVPTPEAAELASTWIDLHAAMARRLRFPAPDSGSPSTSRPALRHVTSGVAFATSGHGRGHHLMIPAGLAQRGHLEPAVSFWPADGQLWARPTEAKGGPRRPMEIRLVEPQTRPWVPLDPGRRIPLTSSNDDSDLDEVVALIRLR